MCDNTYNWVFRPCRSSVSSHYPYNLLPCNAICFCRRWCIGLWKTAFCSVKEHLLESNKPPFAAQTVSHCISKSYKYLRIIADDALRYAVCRTVQMIYIVFVLMPFIFIAKRLQWLFFHNVTIIGSWCIAGSIFSIRSRVLIRRLDVLMQGWHPTYSLFSTSLSISSCTALSLSFISPITETEPGVMSRYLNMSSSPANDRRAEFICADRFFVRNFLSPGIISR